MYSVGIQVSFSAAHYHPGAEPACERLHGHNYRVEVTAESSRLRGGMVTDFLELTRRAEEVVKRWDHCLLNETADFRKLPPTTENISRLVFQKLNQNISSRRWRLGRVKVWETDSCWAAYSEEARS